MDEWEQHEFGDIAKFINGRAYAQNELLPTGKYKVLRVGNFYTNESWYYSNLELVDKYYAKYGDLLYTWSATFGPHIWHGEKVIYHYHIWKVDVSNRLDKYFAMQLLEQDKHDILSGYNGSTMAHITKYGMEKKRVTIPPNIEEQKQLGIFLGKLDNLIALHQHKLTKLQLLKKSMLTKMFPKDGARVPEIRFQGFHDNWEQRRLGECCREFKSGSFISANDIESSGEYPVWGGNGLRGFTNTYNHDGEFALIGRQGALCGNMSYSTGKAYFTEHAVAVQANKTSDTKFIYYLLDMMNLGQYSDQSAQPGLAVGKLIKLINLFPSVKEQKCISTYFTNLDRLITVQQRKLSKLQQIKQAMLSKLFV